MEKITILGGGSWGTALSTVLAGNGKPVTLWCRNVQQAREMAEIRENRKYLPEVALPAAVTVTSDFEAALADCDIVVLAVTSQSVRETAERIKPLLGPDTLIVNVAKGLEVGTNLRLSQVVAEVIPDSQRRFVALYGPSHAEEVGRGVPTAIVAASLDHQAAEKIQDVFMTPFLRIYTNDDLIGVELGGSLKNIIALANGTAAGLGYGDNAQAALLTRGLAEITRLGVEMGAEVTTFSGLTGLGDLVVTCNSRHSRNRRAGLALGQGKKLDVILAEMGMVVEGVKTTKAAVALARQMGVTMPIAEQMYDVLFADADVRLAVSNLMGRNKRSEKEDYLAYR